MEESLESRSQSTDLKFPLPSPAKRISPPTIRIRGKARFFASFERERERVSLNEGEFTSFNPPPLAPFTRQVSKNTAGEKKRRSRSHRLYRIVRACNFFSASL